MATYTLFHPQGAKLYGVEAKEINQAVRNNPDKFPTGYILDCSKDEKNELVKIFDQFNKLNLAVLSFEHKIKRKQ